MGRETPPPPKSSDWKYKLYPQLHSHLDWHSSVISIDRSRAMINLSASPQTYTHKHKTRIQFYYEIKSK